MLQDMDLTQIPESPRPLCNDTLGTRTSEGDARAGKELEVIQTPHFTNGETEAQGRQVTHSHLFPEGGCQAVEPFTRFFLHI